jgi:FkbM family methyltransferase
MAASSPKPLKTYWNLIRKFYILILNDPASETVINGVRIKLPLSHQLPIYLSEHKEYDKLIGRISSWLRTNLESITYIDVGANIGDTIAHLNPTFKDLVVAIEPNETFFSFLKTNYGGQKNIIIIKSICASKAENTGFIFEEKNGTASLLRSENAIQKESITIDLISNQTLNMNRIDLIKVDTDGFDFEVIKGAESTIATNNPVFLFECDIFNNINYVSDINKTLDLFHSCGYNEFLAYDNFGYLIGKYSITDREWFLQLISYQCSGGMYYFDLLFIKDDKLSEFYQSELLHQNDMANSKPRKNAVRDIREILSAHLI